MKFIAALIVAAFIAGAGAHAVPPAYDGPLGNPEEPAMRPYKWLASGLVSLVTQPVIGFKEGNLKFPVLGSVEAVRGVRRGVVEVNERIFRGMIYAPPPPRGSWNHLGYTNQAIDRSVVLRYLTDFATTGIPGDFGKAGAVVVGGEVITDALPLTGAAERELIESRAADTRKARMVRRVLSEPRETVRERAQRMYIGERAMINRRNPYTGERIKQR